MKSFGEAFSISNGGRLVFSQLTGRENVMISYDEGIAVNELAHMYLTNGFDRNQRCIYAFEEKNNKISLPWLKQNNIDAWRLDAPKFRGGNAVSGLVDFLGNIYEETEYSGLSTRVFINWGDPNNYGENFDSATYGIKKLLELQRQPWKRGFQTRRRNVNHLNANAFEASSLSEDNLYELAAMHEKIFFSSKFNSFVSFPSLSRTKAVGPTRRLSSIPEKVMESVAKKNLEVIILSLLKDNPASGYNLIRKVARHFSVVVPQGTAYSLLYDLEKRGVLKTVTLGKEKIYALTQSGCATAAKEIAHTSEAYKHMLSLLALTNKPAPKATVHANGGRGEKAF